MAVCESARVQKDGIKKEEEEKNLPPPCRESTVKDNPADYGASHPAAGGVMVPPVLA
jgi:hypothetical protein